MSDKELDEVLGKFIAEVQKEGQEEYPGKTLYEMICCIQADLICGLSVTICGLSVREILLLLIKRAVISEI